jgi:hypothetical protein
MRRPANWPKPPPAPQFPTPSVRSLPARLWGVLIIWGIGAMFGLSALALKACDDWAQDRHARAVAPQRIAAARAQQEANRQAQLAATVRVDAPEPQWGDYTEQDRLLGLFATALGERNDYAALRSLASLRSRSRTRQDNWVRRIEMLRASGVDMRGVPPPTAITDGGVDKRLEGWRKLGQGDRTTAQQLFTGAIWADADDADAWLGYGMATASGKDAVGALAIAILMYPDAATARARRDQYLSIAAHGDMRRLRELQDLLAKAATAAEHQRQALPPGMVRMSEPFSWGPR